jgi:prepilin-type N-terminal cleavage/methylation domain-containing protein
MKAGNTMHRSNKHGFTLTEVLVAMAIFITVISGVVVLYSGAVSTTRAGYRAIDAIEAGRTAMAVIETDLQTAFTAAEFGEDYQFYGRPEGFTFVGLDRDGNLTRVTYAINRIDGENDFDTVVSETLGTFCRRAIAQIDRAVQVGRIPPGTVGSEVQFLLEQIWTVLLDEGQVTALDRPAFDAELNEFLTAGAPPAGNPAYFDFSGSDLATRTIEIQVRMRTAYMIRYEEPMMGDLDSFRVPVAGGDAEMPSLDDSFGLASFGCTPSEIGQPDLRCSLYKAITDYTGNDIRQDLRDNPSLYFYVNDETVETLYNTKKRELWIRALAQDPGYAWRMSDNTLAVPKYQRLRQTPNSTTGVSAPLDQGDQMTLQELQYAPEIPAPPEVPLNDAGSTSPIADWWKGQLAAEGYTPRDFVVGEQILLRASMLQVPAFDALNRPPYFSYGFGADADTDFRTAFNDFENMLSYDTFRTGQDYDAAAFFSPLQQFDFFTGQAMTGLQNASTAASPLAPRLPLMVVPQYMVVARRDTAESGYYLHWFNQGISVPSAVRRDTPATFVANSG